jgi:hypothetical protein
MSARAAKVLFVFLMLLWAVGVYFGFLLGLLIAIIITIGICEGLKQIGLLPPRSPPRP